MSPTVKKILLKTHLYGGLLFFPYLIIFGLSSLHINHRFGFMEENQEWVKLEDESFLLEKTDDDQQLALAIRDSLDYMGWCPPWRQERYDGSFDFRVTNFGAEYKINLDESTNNITISRRAKGLGHVVHSLHFLGENIPNATGIINSWRQYQNFTVFFILLASITGIILFLKRKNERVVGISIASGSFVLSILFMLYIWLAG